MILVSMERRAHTLYYATKQLYFGRVNFKIIWGGNHRPLEDVLQKGLRKTRVKTWNTTVQKGLLLHL